jgi:hypothetical protein
VIGETHPDLFDRDGYVKGSVFSSLDIGQQRRLDEIGQLTDMHLKKAQDEELSRLTKADTEKDQFRF